ncbi:hypothetical protein ILUMI_15070 [Ignelater luminosus]|uniref:Uncharacterized protein n=1 Tax=Ignelater luminosus TaxID=2038154 RepID=A0A8K0GAB2_IGNLU|nr:hypothetical protein ILUMI_15070 [Ignelater luminosus]
MNIIQIYAPTNHKADEQVEEFYVSVAEATKITTKGEIAIVLGDLNPRIGEGSDGELIGRYGLSVKNERNERLMQFCTEQNFIVANTFFKLRPRHTRENIIRN